MGDLHDAPTAPSLYDGSAHEEPRQRYRSPVGLAKGANHPGRETVGSITRAQLEEIAEVKKADLNSKDVDGAVRLIEGTCRSMGVTVEG